MAARARCELGAGPVLSRAACDARVGVSAWIPDRGAAAGFFPDAFVSGVGDTQVETAIVIEVRTAGVTPPDRLRDRDATVRYLDFPSPVGLRTADSGCGYSIDPLKEEISCSWKSGKGNCFPSRSSAIFLTAVSAFSFSTPPSRLR